MIGLTLRYDRVDNFWFCLLHELAHVGRHMDRNGAASFVDDLTLRNIEGVRRDLKEAEADEWPRKRWARAKFGRRAKRGEPRHL